NVKGAYVWDPTRGTELRHFQAADTAVSPVALLDEHHALAVSTKGILLWDPANGDTIQTLEGKPNAGYAALGGVPSHNRAYAISEGNVIIWDLATAKEVYRFGAGNVTCVTFASDGKTAFTGHNDRSVAKWELTATPPRREEPPWTWYHTAAVKALALSD